jgi:hypothetical protein
VMVATSTAREFVDIKDVLEWKRTWTR